MNQREVMKETARLAAERGWEQDSAHEVYLLNLLSEREDIRRGLFLKVQTLRGDLDRLEQMLKQPSPMLNSLGELQQRPSAVETAVGEFNAASKALRDYLLAFRPTES